MYIPQHFADADPETARRLISENPFGMLVVPLAEGRVEIAHLPFVLDREPGPLGALRVHVARGNSIGAIPPSSAVIAVFTGPHAYVSPRWYEAPRRNVPTWNFTAVHVHGVATRIDDRGEVLRAVADLSAQQEAGALEPWSAASADAAYVDRLLDGVVAFAIRIERFETKMKLSQNRPLADRLRVVEALRRRGAPGDAAVARLVEERAKKGDRA
jgi:transcriptional regulator